VDPHGVQDTANVRSGEYLMIRMRFEDYVGDTVFHCHIAFHEDAGMMGQIHIAASPPLEATPTSSTTTVHAGHAGHGPAAAPVVAQPSFTG
jgi:hypothetical protein